MCGDGDRGQLGISASVKSAMRLTKVLSISLKLKLSVYLKTIF